MTVYVVAIPWDSYRASGSVVFETRKDAQDYCDYQNQKDSINSHDLFVSECRIVKTKIRK